jgi:hypothetical protein
VFTDIFSKIFYLFVVKLCNEICGIRSYGVVVTFASTYVDRVTLVQVKPFNFIQLGCRTSTLLSRHEKWPKSILHLTWATWGWEGDVLGKK